MSAQKQKNEKKLSMSYTFEDLNWEHLRRNMAFKSGVLTAKCEARPGTSSFKKQSKNIPKKEMKTFMGVPCLLPIEIKVDEENIKESRRIQMGPHDHGNGDILIENNEIDDSGIEMDQIDLKKEISLRRDEIRQRLAELDLSNADHRKELTEKTQVLTYKTIKYDMPVAIIYNPNSGKKRNVRQIIAERLDIALIPYEFLESKKVFDTWLIPQEMDIEKYSALVAVGGDGTFHEVVNGLLHRADKKRIPIAFIGNGSGNDTLRQFGCFDIGKALDFLCKGQIIKYDVCRVTIDYESELEVPEEKRNTHLRYNLINSAFGLIAKANYRAIQYKGGCCNPYSRALAVELFKHRQEIFSVYVDDQLVEENVSPVIMAVNNTKFGGAGIIMNPFSVSNDGMIDMFLSSQKLKAGIKTLLTFDEEAQKYKGIHAYNKNLNFYRGKVMKIVNNNYVPDKKGKKGSICSKNSSQNGKKNKNQSLSTTQEEFKQPLMTDESSSQKNHGNPAMNYSSTNLSLKNYRGVPGEKMIQRMALDGEDLLFEDYVKFECLHGDLEIIVDYNYVMESQEMFYWK